MGIENLSGLIAATFTPMANDGSLKLDVVPTMVNQLLNEGVSGLYVCGGTGEGVSLTNAERQQTAEAFVNAANGRIPVILHVGQDSPFAAQKLAKHAAEIGADGISAITPTYFKPGSPSTLVDSLKIITDGAPDLPFIYYHFPTKTGLDIDLVDFLEQAIVKLPSLFAVKFTDSKLHDLQAALALTDNKIKIFFGIDEMLLGGLVAGASGAIGSTYNFAAPLYLKLIQAWQNDDLAEAQRLQALSVQMVRTFVQFGGIEGQKAMMAMVGLDCGTARLPLNKLAPEATEELQNNLKEVGFFDWGRP
ncbi:MAG: dihydrodipicolinate synthase family protein [Pseudomonadales bacterium]|nr:dihydrodipicolinate synthase family protein [Pseudomonadales bacterium]